MKSVWENDILRPTFAPLNTNKNTDVLIIGGGITGILAATKLKEAGVDCMVVEAANICGGITKNTTAKITVQHGLLYDKLIKRFGEDNARLYLKAQVKAAKEYKRRCNSIDCNYELKDSYVYSLCDSEKIKKESDALNKLGINAEFLSSCELPFKIVGAVRVKNQAQFNPLKFLYSLAKDLPIYEHTKVINIMPNKAITNHGNISYKKLIIATHFPMLNKHGGYFLKLYQYRSYVLALKSAQDVKGMYVDEADTGLSFRNYGDLLLLGGGGHRTGKQGGCYKELEDFAKKYYKNAKIVVRFATQDCMTLDGVAYIGQYSKSLPNVFVATGFNKWGMTNAMAAADILCDLVRGKPNRYSEVFEPSRSIMHPQAAVNAFESLKGLLTPAVPRCPHLGCALKYNRAEHSWDCSCHGSRFTEAGELIDNPATADLKFKGKM